MWEIDGATSKRITSYCSSATWSRELRISSLAVVPASLGLPPSFSVHDLLTDERFVWRIGHNFVGFEPGVRQAHVLRVES